MFERSDVKFLEISSNRLSLLKRRNVRDSLSANRELQSAVAECVRIESEMRQHASAEKALQKAAISVPEVVGLARCAPVSLQRAAIFATACFRLAREYRQRQTQVARAKVLAESRLQRCGNKMALVEKQGGLLVASLRRRNRIRFATQEALELAELEECQAANAVAAKRSGGLR